MRALLLAVFALAPASAFGAQALVVVSEPMSSSVREALEGLRSEWSVPFETVSASRPLPPGPHGVIIAFGGRAALRARHSPSPLVVALAPSYRPDKHGTVVVAMTPSPERFVSDLAAAGVKRLLAVRAVPADAEFSRRAAEAGKLAGVEIEVEILAEPGALPRLLRAAGPRSEAIWLAPDPESVTPENFEVAREFARARGIPLFAPAAGLVSDEVRGELTVSFRDCGREAARAAQELLAGRQVSAIAYPSVTSVIAGATVSTTGPSAR